MNDFTKTDLTEIHRCLKYMTKGGTTPYSCHTMDLVKQVRTMIENYPKQIDGFVREPEDYTGCNHDWHDLEIAPPARPTVICIKCRAIHFIRGN